MDTYLVKEAQGYPMERPVDSTRVNVVDSLFFNNGIGITTPRITTELAS